MLSEFDDLAIAAAGISDNIKVRVNTIRIFSFPSLLSIYFVKSPIEETFISF